VDFILKLLKAKKRQEIRGGKLWEITQVWGRDIKIVELEVAKPEPLVRRPEDAKLQAIRVHVIKGEDNVTNLTKDPDLL